jgi:hypothetical protein
MEKLDLGYNNGFREGIMKVAEQFEDGLLEDMRKHKLQVTPKRLYWLFKCMIENRELLRENPFAFVRVNKKLPPGYFEVYVPKGKEVEDDRPRTDPDVGPELQPG